MCITVLWPSAITRAAAQSDLAERLRGRILLQVESYGRAWYVEPLTLRRYYLQNGPAAYDIMRTFGLGITDADLNKIPTKPSQSGNAALVNRLKGRILLQVQQHGEAWYVNPVNGLRYYLRDGQAAYDVMRTFALGISNNDLRQIPMNETQIVADYAFDDVAAAALKDDQFIYEKNADQILPLASLTKLIVALVLKDLGIDWNKKITITQNHLDYPLHYVGNDPTSEVDFKAGDTITVYDAWLAMLVSSSNQAAFALAETSGLTPAEFLHKMNEKAAALGLRKTVFFDIAGLDAHNVTTAKEMALLAKAAFADSEIAQASATTDYTIMALDANRQQRAIKVVNRNYSLLAFGPQAAKSGFLIEAQRTAAIAKDGAIYVVLHARSMAERNALFSQMIALH